MKIHMKINLLFVFLLLPLSLFAMNKSEVSDHSGSSPIATEPEVVQPGYPLEIQDGLGYTVRLEAAPQSIASLTLFSDEVLFSLVDSSRLSAITFLAADPVYSNVAHRAQEVETQLDLNVEALINIYPDIVFTADWSDAAKVEQLRNAGIQVYQIKTPQTVEEIKAEIQRLGEITGQQTEADDIIKVMEETIYLIGYTLSMISEPQYPVALDYNSWGSSMGSSSTWNEILTYASVKNGAAEYEADLYGQVPMSRELIVEINPELLFLPGWIYGDPEGADNFMDEILQDPALAAIDAVQEDHVYMMPENLKSTYSQYIVEAIRFVAMAAYPEFF